MSYTPDHEESMILFFDNLDEKNRRYYAAVEAEKLGHGGIVYIAQLFGITEKTVRKGIKELSKKNS
ncbi:MAG: putative transcriptional regulator [Ulvibacter sp.]|jgi:hypothetical protein